MLEKLLLLDDMFMKIGLLIVPIVVTDRQLRTVGDHRSILVTSISLQSPAVSRPQEGVILKILLTALDWHKCKSASLLLPWIVWLQADQLKYGCLFA